ncbi:endonuclease/exonuclease/phosphatase family protein [Vibrio orientalis]|uniref:Metal-dependent hydrolase n=1 Tax=Vibrio orientalis CIP 102891 = ATCC 33934 TaxID=675816 RepID=A0ABM9Z2S0_VIBOR|nr:endonuclease/exonuclease/phosphatase family protein [Vibrio orientalis]EEX93978.1 metal-dependent hydrolase [Vibrio orientalis CIP 102891 = ATCC 33934]
MQKTWPIISVLALLGSFNSYADTLYSAWNLEWLSSTPSSKFKPSQRYDQDYQSLHHHFSSMESDILAFQEVNDKQALTKVIGSDYQFFFSHRSNADNQRHQFSDINQYTGFAIRKGIAVKDMPDIKLDRSPNSKLRFASYVMLHPNSQQPIHALSVHLKARCSGAYNGSKACRTLKVQGQQLNKWIKEREKNNDAYVILGDFNHNLSYNGDWLWKGISQGTDATLATKMTKANCKVKSRNNPNKTHQFKSLIDHIIVSSDLGFHSPKQNLYKVDDVLNRQMSDHCPISVSIK